jgi:hypothetical protein
MDKTTNSNPTKSRSQIIGTASKDAPATGGGERPGLRVAVIYEDLGTGLRARDVFEGVSHLLDFEIGFELTLWRADILAKSDYSRQIALEAKKIDILFLACHGQLELRAPVKQWFLTWLAARSGRPSALAVSFDTDARETSGMLATLNLLESAARLAGVEVFVNRYDSPPEQKDRTPQNQTGKEGLTNVRERTLRWSGERSFQHWGINE